MQGKDVSRHADLSRARRRGGAGRSKFAHAAGPPTDRASEEKTPTITPESFFAAAKPRTEGRFMQLACRRRLHAAHA